MLYLKNINHKLLSYSSFISYHAIYGEVLGSRFNGFTRIKSILKFSHRYLFMVEKKRLPAIKASPYEIVKGQYNKQEGFTPNYILTPKGKKISRVRVMGTVVKKFINDKKTFGSVTIDDGKGTVRAKIFNAISLIENIKEGNIVDAVGKIREYQNELYINLETLHKINNPNYEILRQLELKKEKEEWNNIRKKIIDTKEQVADLEELKNFMQNKHNISKDVVEAVIETESTEETEEGEDNKEAEKKIFELIENSKEGRHYDELIKETGYSEEVVSEVVNKLLSDGECFEPKPGLIKCL